MGLASCFLATPASAEVTIVKKDTWEVYFAGRVSALFSYATGDAYPPKPAMGAIIGGGGIDEGVEGGNERGKDTIPALGADGMPDPNQQGTIGRMRVRSGVLPNIFTLGMRKKLAQGMTLKAQASIWATIEPGFYGQFGTGGYPPRSSGRDMGADADFREGYLELDAPWGAVRAGRFLSPFARANTELMLANGLRYGVGVPVGLMSSAEYPTGATWTLASGPTGGMAGYGILGASHSAGVQYTTPSLVGGLKIAAGLFEPVALKGFEVARTQTPRVEAEAVYDLDTAGFKAKLFGSSGYQSLHRDTQSVSVYGFAYGGRVEVGPVRLGASGHSGKGVGLLYGFDASPTSYRASVKAMDPVTGAVVVVSPAELRSFQGYSVFLQVPAGPVDLNAAYGRTQVPRLDVDKTSVDSVLKTQTSIVASVVYHTTENLHLTAEFVNAAIHWWGGQKQSVNFINAGATFTF